MSGQCKCGSRAINDDPDRLLCDTCWRDAEIERLREHLRDNPHGVFEELMQALGAFSEEEQNP